MDQKTKNRWDIWIHFGSVYGFLMFLGSMDHWFLNGPNSELPCHRVHKKMEPVGHPRVGVSGESGKRAPWRLGWSAPRHMRLPLACSMVKHSLDQNHLLPCFLKFLMVASEFWNDWISLSDFNQSTGGWKIVVWMDSPKRNVTSRIGNPSNMKCRLGPSSQFGLEKHEP